MLFGDGGFSWSQFCSADSGMLSILQMVGYVLTFIKVAIPFMIIVFGALDFGKAVTAEKPEEIKASAKRLGFRALAGIIVFFLPTIVLWVFSVFVGFNDSDEGFTNCKNCLLSPMSGCASDTVDDANG